MTRAHSSKPVYSSYSLLTAHPALYIQVSLCIPLILYWPIILLCTFKWACVFLLFSTDRSSCVVHSSEPVYSSYSLLTDHPVLYIQVSVCIPLILYWQPILRCTFKWACVFLLFSTDRPSCVVHSSEPVYSSYSLLTDHPALYIQVSLCIPLILYWQPTLHCTFKWACVFLLFSTDRSSCVVHSSEPVYSSYSLLTAHPALYIQVSLCIPLILYWPIILRCTFKWACVFLLFSTDRSSCIVYFIFTIAIDDHFTHGH